MHTNPAKRYDNEPCSADTEMEVQKDPDTQVRLTLDLYGLGSDPIAHLLSKDTRGSPSVTPGLVASGNLPDLSIYTKHHRFGSGALNAMHLPNLEGSMAYTQIWSLLCC